MPWFEFNPRVSPGPVPDFEQKEGVKNVSQHKYLGKWISKKFGKSFDIKVGRETICINKNSLARYICDAYVNEKEPGLYKAEIRNLIETITHPKEGQGPTTLQELIEMVLQRFAEKNKNVKTVLDIGKGQLAQTSEKYQEFKGIFDACTAMRAEGAPSLRLPEQIEKEGPRLRLKEAKIKAATESVLGTADQIIKELCTALMKIDGLPESLRTLADNANPSFKEYNQIVDDLNARKAEGAVDIEKFLSEKECILIQQAARGVSQFLDEKSKKLAPLDSSLQTITSSGAWDKSSFAEDVRVSKKLHDDATKAMEAARKSPGAEYKEKAENLTQCIEAFEIAVTGLKAKIDAKFDELETQNNSAIAKLSEEVGQAQKLKIQVNPTIIKQLTDSKGVLQQAKDQRELNPFGAFDLLRTQLEALQGAFATLATTLSQSAIVVNVQKKIKTLATVESTCEEILSKELSEAISSNKLKEFSARLDYLITVKADLERMEALLANEKAKEGTGGDVGKAYANATKAVGGLRDALCTTLRTKGEKLETLTNSSKAANEAIQEFQQSLALLDAGKIFSLLQVYGEAVSESRKKVLESLGKHISIPAKFKALFDEVRSYPGRIEPNLPLLRQVEENISRDAVTLLLSTDIKPSKEKDLSLKLDADLLAWESWKKGAIAALQQDPLASLNVKATDFQKRRENALKILTDVKKRLPIPNDVREVHEFLKEMEIWNHTLSKLAECLQKFDQVNERSQLLQKKDNPSIAAYDGKKDQFLKDLAFVANNPGRNLADLKNVDSKITKFSTTLSDFEKSLDALVRQECDAFKGKISGNLDKLAALNVKPQNLSTRFATLTRDLASASDGKLDQLRSDLTKLDSDVESLHTKSYEARQTAAEKDVLTEIQKFLVDIAKLISDKGEESMVGEIAHQLLGYLRKHTNQFDAGLEASFIALDGVEEKYLDEVAKVIIEEAKSKEDVQAVSLIIQKLSEKAKSSKTCEYLCKKIVANASEYVKAASEDPVLLQNALEAIISLTQRYRNTTEGAILSLAEGCSSNPTVAKNIAASLKKLFSSSPRETANFRDGIRTIGFLLSVKVKGYSLPKDVKPEVGDAVITLATDLSLLPPVRGMWNSKSPEAAFVFQTQSDPGQANGVSSSTDRSKVCLEVGLQKLQESAPEKQIHPIFMGRDIPESVSSYSEFLKMLDEFARTSLDHPGVTYIPGSVTILDEDNKTYSKALPVFENGRLISMNFLKNGDPNLEAEEDEYAASGANRVRALSKFSNDICLLDGGQAFGIEMGNDHEASEVKTAYGQASPQGQGLDIQLILSQGQEVKPENLSVREYGMVGVLDTRGAVTISAGQSSKERKLPPAEKEVNPNSERLGSFGTYQAGVQNISPQFTQSPMFSKALTSQSPLDLLQAMGIKQAQAAAAISALKDRLSKNKDQYFPSSQELRPSMKDEEIEKTLQNTLRRYTFANEQEIDEFIQLLGNNGDISKYRIPFLKCLSEALNQPIVVYTDLASIGREVFMPDRSTSMKLPENPLEIGFSYAKGDFIETSWEKIPEFSAADQTVAGKISEFTTRISNLSGQSLGQDLEAISALQNDIAQMKNDFEKGTSIQQKVLSKHIKDISELQGKLGNLYEKATNAKTEISNAFAELLGNKAVPSLERVGSAYKAYLTSLGIPSEQVDTRTKAAVTSLQKSIEMFDTLQKFMQASYVVGRLWIDAGTGKLTTGWGVWTSTEGVAKFLTDVSDASSSLLNELPNEQLAPLIEMLTFLQTQYLKADSTISDAAYEFISAISEE